MKMREISENACDFRKSRVRFQTKSHSWSEISLITGIAPDHSKLIPDYSPVIPDHSTVIPDHSPLIPDHSPVIPDHSPVILDHTPLVFHEFNFHRPEAKV